MLVIKKTLRREDLFCWAERGMPSRYLAPVNSE
jgi:hypothetical protein